MICGVAVHGKAPYKAVISHGFTLDEKGNKMSKSLGNTVEPLKMVKLHGADVLRLWVASVDYTEDVRIGDNLMKQVKESYRKIRNTYRFMLGNLNGFDPEKDRVDYQDMLIYDKYMMHALNDFTKDVRNSFEHYEYSEVYKRINHFVTFTLSNYYLDFTKDILYIEKEEDLKRRSVQTVLYEITYAMVRLLAPILPYTSEEVYQFLPGKKEESVHLENNPKEIEYEDEKEISSLFEKFFAVKDDVFKALEEARDEKVIGKGLEAKVMIHAKGKTKEALETLKPYLKQLLIVSLVELVEEELPKYNVCGVKIEKFDGAKCERCWNYYEEDEMHGDICDRCYHVLND